MIYQGGTPDDEIRVIPAPLVLVCLRENENYDRFIDSKRIYAILVHTIMDEPQAALPDDVYFALMKVAFGYLKRGFNLYIHCAAGHSRSGYLTVGMISRVLDFPVSDALAWIRQRRQGCCPNSGFWEHLIRLEPRLRSGGV